MNPLRTVLAAVAVVPLLAACSGKDAVEAEQLLQQSQQAQQSISSETFSAHVTVQAKGQEFGIVLTGGGYLKGARAGDMYMDMSLKAPDSIPLPFDSIEIAKVGTAAWMEMGGKRMSIPAGSMTGSSTAGGSFLSSFDFTRYVKDVSVDHNGTLDGKPVTKITGIVDTAAMLQGLSALGSAGSVAGLPNLDGKVSDTRCVLYIDDASHIPVAALVDASVHADGGDVALHMDFAETGINEPVQLPS